MVGIFTDIPNTRSCVISALYHPKTVFVTGAFKYLTPAPIHMCMPTPVTGNALTLEQPVFYSTQGHNTYSSVDTSYRSNTSGKLLPWHSLLAITGKQAKP